MAPFLGICLRIAQYTWSIMAYFYCFGDIFRSGSSTRNALALQSTVLAVFPQIKGVTACRKEQYMFRYIIMLIPLLGPISPIYWGWINEGGINMVWWFLPVSLLPPTLTITYLLLR